MRMFVTLLARLEQGLGPPGNGGTPLPRIIQVPEHNKTSQKCNETIGYMCILTGVWCLRYIMSPYAHNPFNAISVTIKNRDNMRQFVVVTAEVEACA